MTKEPAYRFGGHTDAWEQRKLGEVVTNEKKGKAKADMIGNQSIYLDTAYLNGGEEVKVCSETDTYPDDVIILWDGSQAGTLYYGFEGALGSTLKSYTISGSGMFIYQQLKSRQQIIYEKYRTPNIPHVVKTFLDEFEVFVPTLAEQTAIGTFFQTLDRSIALHQRKLDSLKEQKKTYLQKLFPRNGETIPEIRFSEFQHAPAWEQRKLGEVLTERNVQQVPTVDYPLVSFTVESGVTPKTDRYNREFLVREDEKKYKVTKKDDIVYNPANLKFGAISLNSYGNAVFSPIYVTYEVNQHLAFPDFIAGIVTSKNFIQRALKYQEGTVYERMAVKSDDFLRLEVRVPELAEQTAIGNFFQTLDRSIVQHQTKLDKLKESKQTLLKKMFI